MRKICFAVLLFIGCASFQPEQIQPKDSGAEKNSKQTEEVVMSVFVVIALVVITSSVIKN